MIVVIFVGPPGCGKGSSGQVVCKDFQLIHVSTGDILRSVASSGTPQGNEIKGLLEQGKLVSDETVLAMISDFMDRNAESTGFLFDGFPRTLHQAQALDSLLQKKGSRVNLVIQFNADKDKLISRAIGRLIHPASGRVYHIVNHPPKVAGKDDLTGEDLVHRDDDNAEVIERRIESYLTSTTPILDFYKNKNNLTAVNANKSLEDVTKAIKEHIHKLIFSKH